MSASLPILVVEDDPHIREFVSIALQDAGYRVAKAADGEAAVEWLRGAQPEALVLDMGLPLVDGAEVARISRALYDGAVPIVIVSAKGDLAAEARELGASAFLRKPFLIEELESVLARAIGSRDSLTGPQRATAERAGPWSATPRVRMGDTGAE